ncbi:unnamed protein product [Pleuronectes platessa]|uniref:Uncharacterized protein n=1 Tax=Pleuronectes platessa TaxID=8262 RepID=A0A9N7TNT1_PLEPL|nr:unnamed protein product [Pleuronectes platessa]
MSFLISGGRSSDVGEEGRRETRIGVEEGTMEGNKRRRWMDALSPRWKKGGQRDNGKKKKANSPSRTVNHANGTPLKKPPPVVRDSNEGSSPVTVARHGVLIF